MPGLPSISGDKAVRAFERQVGGGTDGGVAT